MEDDSRREIWEIKDLNIGGEQDDDEYDADSRATWKVEYDEMCPDEADEWESDDDGRAAWKIEFDHMYPDQDEECEGDEINIESW